MKIRTIQKGIELLGENFRGLWKSSFVASNGMVSPVVQWAVTFAYGTTMVETRNFDSPIKAFRCAIDQLALLDKMGSKEIYENRD